MSGTYQSEFKLPPPKPPRVWNHHSKFRPTGAQLTAKIRSLGKVIDCLKIEKEQLVSVIDRLRKDIAIRDQAPQNHQHDKLVLEHNLSLSLQEREESKKQIESLKDQLKQMSLQKRSEQIGRFELMQKNDVLSVQIKDLTKEVSTYEGVFAASINNIKTLASKIKSERAALDKSLLDSRANWQVDEHQRQAEIDKHAQTAASEDLDIILSLSENMQREIYANRSAYTDLKLAFNQAQSDYESSKAESDKKLAAITAENSQLKKELNKLKTGEFEKVVETDPSKMSKTELKQLVENFNVIRGVHKQTTEELKKCQQMLLGEMKVHAETSLATKKLEQEYKKLLASRETLQAQQQASSNSGQASAEIIKRVAQAEQLIKEMSVQLSKVLYENFKLREYVLKETNKVIPEIDLSLITVENLNNQDADSLRKYESKVNHALQRAKSSQSAAMGDESATSRGAHRSKPSSMLRTAPDDFSATDAVEHYSQITNLKAGLAKAKEQRETWRDSSLGLTKMNGELKSENSRLSLQVENLEREKSQFQTVVARLNQELQKTRDSVSAPLELHTRIISEM